MSTLYPLANQNVRVDQLTGIGNLLAFADALLTTVDMSEARSLIALDLNGISRLEPAQGDQALRWMALVLREELDAPVYRLGADDFAAIIPGDDYSQHQRLAKRLTTRLNHEAKRIGLPTPVVALAVIHYCGSEPTSPADVLGQLHAAVQAAKQTQSSEPLVLRAADMYADVDTRALANRLVERMVELGALLEASQQLASSDPVTGMPNMRAALNRINQAIDSALSTGRPFALLLIDGDHLRRYNAIGYAVGDRMLTDLAHVLREQLRPNDFLARWRVGDEFVIVLPETGVSGASTLAERLRRKVEETSQYWPYPITISIGIAAYPQHGQDSDGLLHSAEAANQRAKAAGRNRTVVAEISLPLL